METHFSYTYADPNSKFGFLLKGSLLLNLNSLRQILTLEREMLIFINSEVSNLLQHEAIAHRDIVRYITIHSLTSIRNPSVAVLEIVSRQTM